MSSTTPTSISAVTHYRVLQAAQRLADETGAIWYLAIEDGGLCIISNTQPDPIAGLFIVSLFPR